MSIFYSKSTNGFYDSAFHDKGALPEDAVEIAASRHKELLDGQIKGSVITADNHGYPTLCIPVDSGVGEDSVAVRAWRDAELTRADNEMNKIQDLDPKARGTIKQWREYRRKLRVLPEHPEFPSKKSLPIAPDN